MRPELDELKNCLDYKAKQIYLIERYERLHYREPIPIRNEFAAQKKKEALKLLYDMRSLKYH